MNKIEINECVYNIHPVYDLYASDKDGNVINIIKKVPMKGNENGRGYLNCGVRKHGQNGQKTFSVHRFVWECHNGIIPKDKVVDHINEVKDDNRLCNLQLLTHSENVKKSAPNWDHSLTRNNPSCVKATNISTNEVLHFNSIYCCSKYLRINSGAMKRVCDGDMYHKSSKSKKDGQMYKFEYVEKENMPDNYIKSAGRPQMSEEDKKKHHYEALIKWLNKEYKCPRCDKVMKNRNRQHHNKKCK